MDPAEVIATLVITLWLSGCQLTPVGKQGRTGPIVSPSGMDLASRALEITDLAGQSDIKSSIVSLSPRVQVLPFIPPAASVYVVRLENVRWSFNSKTNPYIRGLEVFFSAETGQVVKIQSVWPEGVQGDKYPSIASEERQLTEAGRERFELPKRGPKVSLLEAMKKVIIPELAKQLVIYYVLDSSQAPSFGPRPVWIINRWGIPPFHPPRPPGDYPPGSNAAITHLRTVIDAETGERHGEDNLPNAE
jgi:hypothetical protein